MSNTDRQTLVFTSVITTYIGGAMFILGTAGNTMNMIVFCCLKEYRSLVTPTFLATAAFAGQLYLIFSLGFESVSKWIGYDIPSRNSAICKSTLYIKSVSIQIYLTCLCFSSIDRYLMTSRSARQRQFMTQKRALLMICVGVVVWMCAAIPRAKLTTNFAAFNVCAESSDFIATATYLNLFFIIVFPLTILSVFSLLTRKNLGNTRMTNINTQVLEIVM